jgi:hypothetical protein
VTIRPAPSTSATATWSQFLEPCARDDGHKPGKARSLLSVSGRFRLEFFDVFHGMLAGVPPGGPNRPAVRSAVRLAVRLPDGSQRTLEAAPLTMAERHANTLPAPASGQRGRVVALALAAAR